jgi:hypothetical protein
MDILRTGGTPMQDRQGRLSNCCHQCHDTDCGPEGETTGLKREKIILKNRF